MIVGSGESVDDPGPDLDADAPIRWSAAKQALSTEFGVPVDQISDSAVSETWGGEISRQAIIALVVFLIAAGAFLWVRYERGSRSVRWSRCCTTSS